MNKKKFNIKFREIHSRILNKRTILNKHGYLKSF